MYFRPPGPGASSKARQHVRLGRDCVCRLPGQRMRRSRKEPCSVQVCLMHIWVHYWSPWQWLRAYCNSHLKIHTGTDWTSAPMRNGWLSTALTCSMLERTPVDQSHHRTSSHHRSPWLWDVSNLSQSIKPSEAQSAHTNMLSESGARWIQVFMCTETQVAKTFFQCVHTCLALINVKLLK